MYNTLYDISKIINLSGVYIEYKEPNQFFISLTRLKT